MQGRRTMTRFIYTCTTAVGQVLLPSERTWAGPALVTCRQDVTPTEGHGVLTEPICPLREGATSWAFLMTP